jgi:predicted  nucleic acid-binding Zn-ribbon protein
MPDMELARHAEALRKRVDRLVIRVARAEERTRRAKALATKHARYARQLEQELEIERVRRAELAHKVVELLTALAAERRWNRRHERVA